MIFDYVRHLRDVGKAVIVCTHRLDEAQRLCDRFGLLHQGRLLHEGTLAELRQRTGLRIADRNVPAVHRHDSGRQGGGSMSDALRQSSPACADAGRLAD